MKKEKIEFYRLKIGEVLFFSALFLMLFVDYVSATYVSLTFSGRLVQLTVILLGCKLLLTKYTWKEWMVIGILLFLGGLSFLNTGKYLAWELFLLLAASKDIDKKKAVKMYFVVVGAITVIAGVAAATGVFGELYQVLNFRGPQGAEPELRYCFGYNHPNTCHIVYIQLALAFVWLYYDKLKWYIIGLIAVANVVLGLFTDSRTGILLGSVIFIFLMVIKKWNHLEENKVIYMMNYVTLIGCIILSYLAVTIGINNPLLAILSKLWTGRIEYANLEAASSRLSLLSGSELQISCDMGFVKLLYNCGIVMAAVFLAIAVLQIFVNHKRKDVAELTVIFCGLIFLLGEKFSSGEFITRNILVIFMIGMWGYFSKAINHTKE